MFDYMYSIIFIYNVIYNILSYIITYTYLLIFIDIIYTYYPRNKTIQRITKITFVAVFGKSTVLRFHSNKLF